MKLDLKLFNVNGVELFSEDFIFSGNIEYILKYLHKVLPRNVISELVEEGLDYADYQDDEATVNRLEKIFKEL